MLLRKRNLHAFILTYKCKVVNCSFNLKRNLQFFYFKSSSIVFQNEPTEIHQAAFSIDGHKVKALVAIVTLIRGLGGGQDKQGGSCFVPLHLDIISLEEALVSQGCLGTSKVWVFVNSYKRWLALKK